MLMLLAWVGMLVLGQPVPIWLEGLAAANLYLTANCRAASDMSGVARLRAATFAAQLFFATLIGVWFAFRFVSEQGITLHARSLVIMVLGFSSFCEAAYAYLRKDELGWRWLIGLAPALLVLVLVLLAF